MTKEEIQKEILEMDAYLPVSKIEERLGMPKTTLQKVLSGERELPKKWLKVLSGYFNRTPLPPKKEVIPPTQEKESKPSKSDAPNPKDKVAYLKWLKENK